MRRLRTRQGISTGLAAAAAAILAVAVPLILLTPTGPDSALGRAAAAVLAVVQVASLAWMREHPERSMAVALATGVGLEAVGPRLGVLGFANFSLCAFAALRPPRASLWALGFMLAFTPWATVRDGALAGIIAAGSPLLSWSWGELLRTSRERRRDAARRAVAEERARIARELHDVVAHNVSLIVVQAVAADDVFDARPDQAREALRAIETSGRAALAELRRLLSTVSEERNDPQPGLEQLDALVASVRAAGLDVRLRSDGAPGPIPAGVALSAYRIVQEALTNSLRHARATRADVTVRYSSTAVEVEVTDDGRGAGAVADGGHGLVGMRERAALLGGTLEVGDAPRGGFRVRAALPLEASA